MSISINQIIGLINQEIRWCINNYQKAPSAEYANGFIAGLEQTKKIIEASNNPHELHLRHDEHALYINPEEEIE